MNNEKVYVARYSGWLIGIDEDSTDLMRRMTEKLGYECVVSPEFQIALEPYPHDEEIVTPADA
jgi:hypothetical protein